MSTREINITQALVYPFLLRNWLNTLLLPGLLLCSVWAVGNVELDNSKLNIPEQWCVLVVLAIPIVQWCCTLLVLAIPIGYAWRLIHILQTNGYDTAAPDWTAEKTFRAFLDGLKIILLIVVIEFVVLQPDSFTGLESMLTNTLTIASTPIVPDATSSLPPELAKQMDAAATPTPEAQPSTPSVTEAPDIAAPEMNPAAQAAYAKAMQIQPSAAPTAASNIELQSQQAQSDPAQDPEAQAAIARAKAAYPEAQPTPVQQQIPLVINCIRIVVFIAFATFLLAAIAQSAETRSLSHLCNIRRTLQVGMKGYGKSLLVLLVSAAMLSCAYFSFINQELKGFIFFCFVLAYVITISFHLLAQSADSNK